MEHQNGTLSQQECQLRRKILRMDNQSLNEYLNQMMLENPVIEIEDATAGLTDGDIHAKKLAWLEGYEFDDGLEPCGLDEWDLNDAPYEDPPSGEIQLADPEPQSLPGYLKSQLAEKVLDPRTRAAAEYIVDCLDENGYLLATRAEIEAEGFSPEQAAAGLKAVQNLEPLGIGAETLSECLLLQLDEADELAQAIVQNGLPSLEEGLSLELAQRFGSSLEEVQAAIARIRRLNPRPGSAYSSYGRSPYLTPDVVMIKFMEEYYVVLSDFAYPELHISEEYQHLLRRTEDPETKEYIKQRIEEAQFLQSCVLRRNELLLQVAKALVRMQGPFFRYGPKYLKLLSLSELAADLAIDPDLVWCAVKRKSIQTPYGVYPMHFFVEKGADQLPAGLAQVKECLSQLISQEDRDDPYTDERLSQMLEQKGLFLSEEMVEQYRGLLHIPDSEHRIFYDPQHPDDLFDLPAASGPCDCEECEEEAHSHSCGCEEGHHTGHCSCQNKRGHSH